MGIYIRSVKNEVRYLKRKGLDVVFNRNATHSDFKEAFIHPVAKFIMEASHGMPSGYLQLANNEKFFPDEVKNSSNLQKVVLESCFQGDEKNLQRWQNVLGDDVDITAWEGQPSWESLIDFNNSGKNNENQPGNLMDVVKEVK